MEFRGDRFVFGLLVLLFCAIAAWRGPDRTPSKMVVELVSVTYKPARMVAFEPVPMEPKVAGEWANAQSVDPAQETSAATEHAAVRRGQKPEPPLPAVFMPIRRLGFYLQARLGAPQHPKASRERKR